MQCYVWIIFLTIIAYIFWFNVLEKLKSWWNGVYDVEIWHERMLHEMQENEDTWQVIYEICDICYVNS